MLPVDRLLDELVLHTTAFAAAARVGDPSARVPACPDWSLTDLVAHLGRVHRWAATTVEQGEPRLASRSDVTDTTVPDAEDEVSAWLLAGAVRFAEAVRTAHPDVRVGGFAGPVPASFWARRQAQETLVHRFDAELAAGIPPPRPDVAADVAADGVSELLELTAASPRSAPGLAGCGQTLHLHATDEGLGEAGEWVITREQAGIRVEHGHRKADVAVRGPATAILMVLTSRRTTEDAGVDVLGDAELVAHWRVNVAF